MRLSFPRRDQTLEPGQFQKDEICYLTAGGFRIDCFDNGSTLNLGPEDSTPLLSDNPMWDINSDEDDPLTSDYMRLYGVIFLVGSSVERLPDTLANYIQDPGRHASEAGSVALALVNQKQIELEGHARGGNFKLYVQLTDAGRDRLVDALNEAGQTIGGNQLAGARTHGRGPGPGRLLPVRSQPRR